MRLKAIFDQNLEMTSTRGLLTLLKRYQLRLKFKVKTLSKGMLQKVGLILSLLGEYDIYLFDEPFEGLDDLTCKLFLEDLEALKDKLVIIAYHKRSTLVDSKYKSLIIEDGQVILNESV